MSRRRRTAWIVLGAGASAALVATLTWQSIDGPGHDRDVEHAGVTRAIPTAPIEPRMRTQSAWSGRELLVWSGAEPVASGPDDPLPAYHVLDDGAAYDPTADTWRMLPDAPIPGRVGAAAVWADDRLVVWGGFDGVDSARDDGAVYLPDEDEWVPLPPAPITGRGDATAVWTGEEVLIVGGADRPGQPGRIAGVRRDGAAYDPRSGRWRVVPPIPDGVWPLRDRGIWPIRERFAGTWTGDELFMWGRGAAHYRPETDTWRRTDPPPADIRIGGGVFPVQLGADTVVIGLANRADPDSFGVIYGPATGEVGSVPPLRVGAMNRPRQVVASDREVVVLVTDPPAAAIWAPGDPGWRSIPTELARGPEAASAWTGQELLVWGGSDRTGPRDDGLVWTP